MERGRETLAGGCILVKQLENSRLTKQSF